MPIEFRCTQCNKLLQTPDDTAGKQAQCPECGAIVAIPSFSPPTQAGSHAGAAPPPPPSGSGTGCPFAAGSSPPSGAGSDPSNPYRSPSAYEASLPIPDVAAASRVSGPAIGLIVTAALGMLMQLLGIFSNCLGMAFQQRPFQQQPEALFSGGVGIGLGIFNVALGTLILYGALKMKNLENFGLALTASILAMAPCLSPCCFLGLPLGIWSLIVLLDPRVRASFHS